VTVAACERARAGEIIRLLDCLANALLDPPRQFLLARREYARHPFGIRVVRGRRSDRDFLGADSQLVREQ
jgi:hypothetical protein